MEDWVINAAYAVSLLALGVRDVLPLRALLLAGQALFLAWGVLIENTPTVAWNAAFMTINAVMIARVAWERRPLEIPAALRDLYDEIFSPMSARDFLLLWEMGDPHRAENEPLVRQGATPDALKLILAGTARVQRDGRHVADIGRGGFVAEMSLLSGQPASADVTPTDAVDYLAWSREKLATLERLNPSLYLALQKALGRDLTRKARRDGSGG